MKINEKDIKYLLNKILPFIEDYMEISHYEGFDNYEDVKELVKEIIRVLSLF